MKDCGNCTNSTHCDACVNDFLEFSSSNKKCQCKGDPARTLYNETTSECYCKNSTTDYMYNYTCQSCNEVMPFCDKCQGSNVSGKPI